MTEPTPLSFDFRRGPEFEAGQAFALPAIEPDRFSPLYRYFRRLERKGYLYLAFMGSSRWAL